MAAVAWLPDAQNEVFAEDEVKISALAQIFRQAFYNVLHQEDGYFIVSTDGPTVMIFLDHDAKLIRFASLYPIKESAPLELKHAYINKMNHRFILGCFSIPESEPDLVIADYSLMYEKGVKPFHLVSMFRLFLRIVGSAITALEEGDLLEIE
ncbi:MAG: YbjN domain-containing protein [Gammaproteobacteria bacterium]